MKSAIFSIGFLPSILAARAGTTARDVEIRSLAKAAECVNDGDKPCQQAGSYCQQQSLYERKGECQECSTAAVKDAFMNIIDNFNNGQNNRTLHDAFDKANPDYLAIMADPNQGQPENDEAIDFLLDASKWMCDHFDNRTNTFEEFCAKAAKLDDTTTFQNLNDQYFTSHWNSFFQYESAESGDQTCTGSNCDVANLAASYATSGMLCNFLQVYDLTKSANLACNEKGFSKPWHYNVCKKNEDDCRAVAQKACADADAKVFSKVPVGFFAQAAYPVLNVINPDKKCSRVLTGGCTWNNEPIIQR